MRYDNMKRATTILTITWDEERVKKCTAFTSEGFERWRKDRGKQVVVFIPPVENRQCDEVAWEVVTEEGLSPKPWAGRAYVCRHMLDTD